MKHKRKIIISIAALVLFGMLVSGSWALWRFVIPRSEIAYNLILEENDEDQFHTDTFLSEYKDQATLSLEDDDIKVNQNSYESSDMKISIETVTTKDLVYHVADIIMYDSAVFHTAFAQDTFGINIKEDPLSLAGRYNSILAINGDYYGWRDDGIIIRNGKLYRNEPVRDMLAIYSDGTMKVLNEFEYSSDEKILKLLDDGVIDTFSYGPALILNGEKITDFSDSVHYLNKKHPRTTIGIIEPYHFVFVVVDGRIDESMGVDLEGLADIMEDLGCTEAYNFDGGKSSIMIFNGGKINLSETRDLSDIIYFANV